MEATLQAFYEDLTLHIATFIIVITIRYNAWKRRFYNYETVTFFAAYRT